METSSQPTALERVSETTDYIRTGCMGIELMFNLERAEAMRSLLIEAVGRDCVCEPEQACWMVESALSSLTQREVATA